jgi:hypothetical protein
MHHQTICLTYDFELGQWVVTQAATAQSALAANVVSTATKNTATPSTDEAKITTTEPSPASNNNDLFNWNSNLDSNVGLCLDKVCQWLLGWLLGSCDCFFLCMLVERKCTSFCRFVIRCKVKVFLVYRSQLCNSNNHLAITSFWAQNNSALRQQQLLQQQLLQQAK